MELSSKELGAEVKRLRKKNFLSQKELAEGICTQATISSIEKGRAFPSIDVLHYLAKRLNVSMDYFFRDFHEEREHYINDTVKNIEGLLNEKKYDEIYELTQFERKLRSNRDLGEQFNQFIDWHHYRAAQHKGLISWETCVEELKTLVRHKGIHKLQFQDLKIKNIIANVLAENEREDEALHLYKELIMAEININDYNRFKLKVFFNLSKLYFFKKNYIESIKIAEQGISLSLKLRDISMLGNLYLQAAQSMMVLHYNIVDIKEYLGKAKFLYQLINRSWHFEFVERLEASLDVKEDRKEKSESL